MRRRPNVRRLNTYERLVCWTPKDSRGQWRKAGLPKSIDLRVVEYRVPGFEGGPGVGPPSPQSYAGIDRVRSCRTCGSVPSDPLADCGSGNKDKIEPPQETPSPQKTIHETNKSEVMQNTSKKRLGSANQLASPFAPRKYATFAERKATMRRLLIRRS